MKIEKLTTLTLTKEDFEKPFDFSRIRGITFNIVFIKGLNLHQFSKLPLYRDLIPQLSLSFGRFIEIS